MQIGGVSEVADALGISPQRMRALRTTGGSNFPAPVAELSAGPVWDLDEVFRWDANRRGPGRPPKNVLGGRFELEGGPIGQGGFADVYRAVDQERPEEVVAVKVLRQVEHGDAQDRFQRELRLLQELSHPNIIPVLGAGVDGSSRPWYAMPLAVGNLHEVLNHFADDERDSLDREEAILEVMLQVCAGLEYLHHAEDEEGAGILHRDLCPQNILRTSTSTWAIADFGLAREAERRTTLLTNSSIVLGHIQYLAPEQLSALKVAEQPADVYALGRTLQAMVLGRDPEVFERFEDDSVFRAVIRKATQQDPMKRYGSVAEVSADLKALQLAPRGDWEPPSRTLQRIGERMREPGPISHRTLDDLQAKVLENRDDLEARRQVALALPALGSSDLAYLVDASSDRFDQLMEIWTTAVAEGSFTFEFCDELADFGERSVHASSSDEVLSAVLRALVVLGRDHNRWHVRSVVIRLLQRIRDRGEALVALDALRACPRDAVDWSISSFARQSLHPLIRDGLADAR